MFVWYFSPGSGGRTARAGRRLGRPFASGAPGTVLAHLCELALEQDSQRRQATKCGRWSALRTALSIARHRRPQAWRQVGKAKCGTARNGRGSQSSMAACSAALVRSTVWHRSGGVHARPWSRPIVRKRRSQRADQRCGGDAAPVALGGRCQVWARQQPATAALIVVAIGCPCGTIRRAYLCHQVADLARSCGGRAVMMVRRLARYSGDQAFEIVGHVVFRGRRAAVITTYTLATHPLYDV